MPTPLRVLCVDDEENVLRSLKRLLLDEPYELFMSTSGAEGLAILRSTSPLQVIVSDYRMPGMNGVEFLREVRASWPNTIRIVLSGYADTAAIVAAINEGQIYRFIAKPWNDDELRLAIANAFERYELQEKNALLSQELKKRNQELLELNMILKDRITDKVGDLESQNRKLIQEQSMLRYLPLPVMGLSKEGTWLSYCNERAQEEFRCSKYEITPLKRSDIFSGENNGIIDTILRNGNAPQTILVNEKTMRVYGVWIKGQNGEKKPLLIFSEIITPVA